MTTHTVEQVIQRLGDRRALRKGVAVRLTRAVASRASCPGIVLTVQAVVQWEAGRGQAPARFPCQERGGRLVDPAPEGGRAVARILAVPNRRGPCLAAHEKAQSGVVQMSARQLVEKPVGNVPG